ncbi:MAG: hypothetical protein GX992_04850 [Clostridium sp.]|nr:hypothetical protein [Clostridium sp.]
MIITLAGLSLKDHIEGHFLTCFLGLLLRLTEKQVDQKYSTRKLIDTMENITGTYVDKNYYMFDYYDKVVEELKKVTNTDFSRRFMTLGEIKYITANVKKYGPKKRNKSAPKFTMTLKKPEGHLRIYRIPVHPKTDS